MKKIILFCSLFLFTLFAFAQISFDVLGGATSASSKVGGFYEDTVSDARGIRFDECSYINKVVAANSFVSVKVMNPDLGNNDSESGLMLRDGLSDGARYVAVTVNGNRYLKIRARWYENGLEYIRGVGTVIRKSSNFWLKIEPLNATNPDWTVFGIYIKYGKNAAWEFVERGSFVKLSSFNAGIVSANGSLGSSTGVFAYKQLKFGTPTARMSTAEYPQTLSIFPNPATDRININIDSAEIQIFSADGRLVYTGKNQKSIDISDLPSGMYYLRAGKQSRRFNKLR